MSKISSSGPTDWGGGAVAVAVNECTVCNFEIKQCNYMCVVYQFCTKYI